MTTTKLPPDKKLTYEEFLAWCDEDTRAEWVDGEVVMVSPASERHEDLRRFLGAVIGIFVEQRGLGRVLGGSFQMRLAEPVRSSRQPNMLFVSAARTSSLKETHLDGPADLVVEISSAESRLRDRGEKFAEYEMGGVRGRPTLGLTRVVEAPTLRGRSTGWPGPPVPARPTPAPTLPSAGFGAQELGDRVIGLPLALEWAHR